MDFEISDHLDLQQVFIRLFFLGVGFSSLSGFSIQLISSSPMHDFSLQQQLASDFSPSCFNELKNPQVEKNHSQVPCLPVCIAIALAIFSSQLQDGHQIAIFRQNKCHSLSQFQRFSTYCKRYQGILERTNKSIS